MAVPRAEEKSDVSYFLESGNALNTWSPDDITILEYSSTLVRLKDNIPVFSANRCFV
ncbi:MAG: hypothetical protein AAGA18_03175 [Verrucomicrobiota bacterium]